MSVLIKGMKMPKNCGACPLETDYGTCGYYSLFVEAGHDSEIWKRRDDCPLIELPPHGRLIDADALMKLEVIPSDNWVFRAVEKAPTINPAEEGE